MGFQDNFPGVHAKAHNQLATCSAVYNPISEEEAVPCKVIIEHDTALLPNGADYEIPEYGTTLEALYDDVGVPLIGSTFETSTAKYTVKRIEENDRVFVKMVVVEDED